MVLALKNGSSVSTGHPRSPAGSARSSGRSCANPPRPAPGATRPAIPRSIGRSPDACGHPRPRPRVRAFPKHRAVKTRDEVGWQERAIPSHADDQLNLGADGAAQSSAARMPASGPGKSSTASAITGRPRPAKRAGSPLALRRGRRIAARAARSRGPESCGRRSAHRLVAAAHPPREAAGEQHAGSLTSPSPPSSLTALALVPRGFLLDEARFWS